MLAAEDSNSRTDDSGVVPSDAYETFTFSPTPYVVPDAYSVYVDAVTSVDTRDICFFVTVDDEEKRGRKTEIESAKEISRGFILENFLGS